MIVAVGSGVCSAFITAEISVPLATRQLRCESIRMESVCALEPSLAPRSAGAAAVLDVNFGRRRSMMPSQVYIARASPNEDRAVPFDEDPPKPMFDSFSYVGPPITLEALRRKFGTRSSIWGDWNSEQTRRFYKQQLPKALQMDGALGLSLEERARLASQARSALRIYARERSHLPIRLFASAYDGLRHLYDFGSWSSSGMNWVEVKQKYSNEAKAALGAAASPEELDSYVYRRIVSKACSTNEFIDGIALREDCKSIAAQLWGLSPFGKLACGVKRSLGALWSKLASKHASPSSACAISMFWAKRILSLEF